MRVKLDYGKTGLDVELPDSDRVVGPLAIREAAPLTDTLGALEAALAHPIGTLPLLEQRTWDVLLRGNFSYACQDLSMGVEEAPVGAVVETSEDATATESQTTTSNV